MRNFNLFVVANAIFHSFDYQLHFPFNIFSYFFFSFCSAYFWMLFLFLIFIFPLKVIPLSPLVVATSVYKAAKC